MSREIIVESDDHRISANHIEDQWNSQIHHPDLRFPIVVNVTSADGKEEEELRLSLDAARRVHVGLGKAIQEAERDLQKALPSDEMPS